jgi:hypothetical protein
MNICNSESDDYLASCSIFPKCDAYSLISECNDLNEFKLEILDGPCLWLLMDDQARGKCVSLEYLKDCDSFLNENQCNEKFFSNKECVWDDKFGCIEKLYKFHVKNSGVDSSSCSTYEEACKTFDYVMKNNVNIIGRLSVVYIDSGTYFYYLFTTNTEYSYIKFNISGFISPQSSVEVIDVSTYPLINIDNTSSTAINHGFRFSTNCRASFQYLSFYILNNFNRSPILFISFFFFFFIKKIHTYTYVYY